MPDSWATALAALPGSAALAVAPAAVFWAALRWRRVAGSERRWLVILAAGLAAAALPRAAFQLAAAPFGWPDALWAPPLDRFASAIGLAGLGLLAAEGRARALTVGLLLAALASALGWLAWLVSGAALVAPAGGPSGATIPWDLALAVLIAIVATVLARGPRPAPRWVLAALAALVAGSLWDALAAASAPQAATTALGARLGGLAACAIGLGGATLWGRRLDGTGSPEERGLWEAIAHEMRLVHASLAGYQELLQDGTTRTAEQDMERHLRAIVAQSHRLEVLVANAGALLPMRRRGPIPAAPPADTAQRTVLASLARAEPHFQVKSIRAEPHVALEAVGDGLDPGTAGLIVDNLLLGAVHRSPHGAPLTFRADIDGAEVIFSVDYQDTVAPADGPFQASDEPWAHFGFVRLLAGRLGGETWRGPSEQGGRRRLVVRLPVG